MNVLSILTNEKHFPKTISQWEFDCAGLQIYRELLSLATFLRVHSNSKEVSYLSWQNTYPNLKTTYHIKLKFFLWTKLLENLLHAKYLISVAAPLIANTCVILRAALLQNLPIHFSLYCYYRQVGSTFILIHQT